MYGKPTTQSSGVIVYIVIMKNLADANLMSQKKVDGDILVCMYDKLFVMETPVWRRHVKYAGKCICSANLGNLRFTSGHKL